MKGKKKIPSWGFSLKWLFFRLFMLGVFLAPFAELLQLDLFSDELLVLAGPVVNAFA